LLAAPKALDFFVDLPFERSALQMGAIPPEVVAAGASGAILGCLAALVVQQLRHSNISLGFGMISAVLSLLYNVVSGFAPNSGIDVGAHIGGVLGGILFSLIALPHGPVMHLKQAEKKKAPVLGTIRGTKFCRFCGVRIARDSRFCEECGATLVETEAPKLRSVAVEQETPASHKRREIPAFKMIIVASALIVLIVWAPRLASVITDSGRPVLDWSDQYPVNMHMGTQSVIRDSVSVTQTYTYGTLKLTIRGMGSFAVESIEVRVDGSSVGIQSVDCECQYSQTRFVPPLSMNLPSDLSVNVLGEWYGLSKHRVGDDLKIQITGIWTFLGHSERIVLNSETSLMWAPT